MGYPPSVAPGSGNNIVGDSQARGPQLDEFFPTASKLIFTRNLVMSYDAMNLYPIPVNSQIFIDLDRVLFINFTSNFNYNKVLQLSK